VSVLTDEHVPSVFITTLRSNGHEVVKAREAFGEATDDEQLLQYCGENGHLLVTHDKTDFAGSLADGVDHAGIVVYTDANYLRDDPESAVRTLERIVSHYPPGELVNELVWLDQWRR
jgi:predicted nuclease of predicted toxin-antitoxin system